MARVTVEDCLQKINNRFDLILLAAQRARNIGINEPVSEVPNPNAAKTPIIALREIAEDKVDITALYGELVNNMGKVKKPIKQKDEVDDYMAELEKLQMDAFVVDSDDESFKDLEGASAMMVDSDDDLLEEGHDYDDEFAKALAEIADILPDDK